MEIAEKKTMTKQSTSFSRHENNDEDKEFGETFEFQSVVVKALTEVLDQRLELTNGQPLQMTDSNNEEGIKLFSTSTCPLRHCDQPYTMPVRKKRTYSTSSNSSEDERLAESAVTQEFIFRDSKSGGCKQDDTSNNSFKQVEQQNDASEDVIAKNRTKKKKKKHIKQIDDP